MHGRGVVMLGAAALAVAGCGADDSADDRPTTKARFVAQAAEICREVERAHRPYAEQVDRLPQNAGIKRVAPLLEATLQQSRAGLARLRALDAPPADKGALDAYFAAAERLLEAHARLADAARTNDPETGAKVAAGVGRLSDDERRLAAEYGLRACEDVF